MGNHCSVNADNLHRGMAENDQSDCIKRTIEEAWIYAIHTNDRKCVYICKLSLLSCRKKELSPVVYHHSNHDGHNSSNYHIFLHKICDRIGEIFSSLPKAFLFVESDHIKLVLLCGIGTCSGKQLVFEHYGSRLRLLWRSYVHLQNDKTPLFCDVDFQVMCCNFLRTLNYDMTTIVYWPCFCIIVVLCFIFSYVHLTIPETVKKIQSNNIKTKNTTVIIESKVIFLSLVLILVTSNQMSDNVNLLRERKISPSKGQYFLDCLSKIHQCVNNNIKKDGTMELLEICANVKTGNVKSFLYDIINYCQPNRSDSVMAYPVTGNANMSSELMRLGTLHNFPPENAPSLIRLAAAGFYFEGKGREATCFSCGVRYDNWSNNSVPLEVHRQISPNCNFIKELCQEREQENSSYPTNSHSQQHTEAHFSAPCLPESDFIRACTDPDDNLQASLLISSSGIPVSVQNGVDCGLYNSNQSYPRSSIQTSRRGQSSLLTSASRDSGFLTNSFPGRSGDSRFYTDSSSTRSSDSGYASSGYSSSRSNNALSAGRPMLSMLSEGQEQSLQTTPSARDSPLPLVSQMNTVVKEKYPEYIPIERRRATFKKWPESINFLHPLDLAECGFFYTNFGDCVRCFHCGIGLRNWESDDNPWVEHARWSRKCPYLQVKKGQEFIDNVLKVLGLQTDAEIEQQVTTAATGQTETGYDKNQANNVLDPLLHPAAQYVIREQIFGSNKDRQVKMVMNQLLQVQDWNDITNDILVNAFLENKDGLEFMETKPSNENLSASNTKSSSSEPTVKNSSSNDKGETNADDPEKIQKENEELKDLYTCKICLDERVGITFVPCGHLVTCRNCSPKIRRCPLCRTFIRGTIKTTM